MVTNNPAAPLILVVEDDDSHAELIQRSFELAQEEYRLQIVTTLDAARNSINVQSPDLLLSDFRMPDGEGIELLSLVNEAWPVIFMTSQGNEQIAVAAMKGGAQDYIVKSPEAFSSIVYVVAKTIMEWNHKLELNYAKKKLKDEEKALLESEKRYRSLMENVPAIIYKYSTKSGGLFYSPQVEQVFGYPLKAFYDNPLLWKNSIHPDDAGKVSDAIGKICFGGECKFDIEYRICTKFGEWLWLRDSLIKRDLKNGEVIVDGIAQNITKLKQAEEERLLFEEQFQQTQKLESLGVLTGGIAHDFNNILTIIIGHCFMAKENAGTGIGNKPNIEHIENAANRAADLCRQMLTYAGKSPLVQTQVNMWLLVDESVKMLKSALKKNVAINVDLKRDVPEVVGDSSQIQQIIMNLIINAGEAIGDNNGTVNVSLSKVAVSAGEPEVDFFGTSIQFGRYACIKVSDDGCGMTEDTQKRMFEPFYTTKFTGRGLGLSAVLGILRAHGGTFQLLSKPGIGTTFKVYFPLPAAPDVVEAAKVDSLASVKGNGTILLVDDEEPLIKIGTALLKAMGFSVISASNGNEAIKAFSTHKNLINLVLLDMFMPGMGGEEAYHELRKIDKTVPIIICSGYDAESAEEITMADDRSAFLHKPYKPAELLRVLNEKIGANV